MRTVDFSSEYESIRKGWSDPEWSAEDCLQPLHPNPIDERKCCWVRVCFDLKTTKRFHFIWLALLIVVLGVRSPLRGQNWQQIEIPLNGSINCLYNDTVSGRLYLGGSFENINGIPSYGIARYDGSNWGRIRSDDFGFPITCIESYKNKIYFGGFGGLLVFDGMDFERISCNGQIRSMYVYEDQLLVGGLFQAIGGDSLSSIATWDGTSWYEFQGTQQYFKGTHNSILSMKAHQGDLFIAGNIDGTSNGNELMKWNGSNWTAVGFGIGSGNANWINDLEVFEDQLIVAGHFFEQTGWPGNCIARWDGQTWHAMGDGIGPGQAFNVLEYGDKLYVAGQFDRAGNILSPSIAYWDWDRWCSFGGMIDNSIFQMAQFNGDLYVGGGFQSIDGDSIRYLAAWVGGSYVDTCSQEMMDLEYDHSLEYLNVHPNPTDGTLTLNLTLHSPAIVEIHDLQGRPALPAQPYRDGERLDVSALPAGLYLLQVRQRGAPPQTIKFVKE